MAKQLDDHRKKRDTKSEISLTLFQNESRSRETVF